MRCPFVPSSPCSAAAPEELLSLAPKYSRASFLILLLLPRICYCELKCPPNLNTLSLHLPLSSCLPCPGHISSSWLQTTMATAPLWFPSFVFADASSEFIFDLSNQALWELIFSTCWGWDHGLQSKDLSSGLTFLFVFKGRNLCITSQLQPIIACRVCKAVHCTTARKQTEKNTGESHGKV